MAVRTPTALESRRRERAQLSLAAAPYPHEEVRSFVDAMQEAKIEALARTVRLVARDAPDAADGVHCMVWLRDSGIVSDQGYERVRGALSESLPKKGAAGFDL